MKFRIKRILLSLAVLMLAVVLYAAFVPPPKDVLLPEEQWGAGVKGLSTTQSGLQREFPSLNGKTSPDMAELGRLLFFDPILSGKQDRSCATCHNPSLGFSDGLQTPKDLSRNSLSLWNVGYGTVFFWDGRATSLEDQMLTPLLTPDEMAGSPDAIVSRLSAIPEYVVLFNKAFGGGAESITMENIQSAIAAFERTLISNNSPFDRYAAGQFDALTAPQRRGLNLFRSAATRCFECHAAPTFGSDEFFVTGVPNLPGQEHDPGRAAIVSTGIDGAFKAPTLRNIALTAPYMHNGIFATLEQVIDFYARGGGRDQGIRVDRHILPFELSEQEKQDLVAFLYALTDESNLPEIPQSVPSGLPVVQAVELPAREVVSQYNIPETGTGVLTHEPDVIQLRSGESIQQAIDRAGPGDTIEVPFGVYYEAVVIDWSDIKLIGIPNDKGEWPTLDGEGNRSDGLIASGNNFEMGFFNVRNYTSNGILVEGATGVYLHDLYVEDAGIYGVYPVQSTDILIERIEATGMNDAGIYAGKSENVIIRDTVTYGNVTGIEVENSVNVEIYQNHAHDNSMGISIFLLPNLPSKVSMYTKVHNNVIENNNHENFAPETSIQAGIPSGSGILIMAADHVEVYENTIKGNKTGGIGIFNLGIKFDLSKIDVGPNPEHNYIHDNTFENNGYDADPFVRRMVGRGYDIIWDGTGVSNTFAQPDASSFPPLLPSPGWPDAVDNLYWRLINLLSRLIM
jgi:cytochrome c peroxidase